MNDRDYPLSEVVRHIEDELYRTYRFGSENPVSKEEYFRQSDMISWCKTFMLSTDGSSWISFQCNRNSKHHWRLVRIYDLNNPEKIVRMIGEKCPNAKLEGWYEDYER